MRRRARSLAALGAAGVMITVAACGSDGGQAPANPDKPALFEPSSEISYS